MGVIGAIIGLLVILGYIVAQVFALTHPLPTENHDLIQRTFGTFDMLVGTVIGFYFGNSHRQTTETPNAATPPQEKPK